VKATCPLLLLFLCLFYFPSPLPCAVISSTTQGRPSPSEGRGKYDKMDLYSSGGKGI